MKQLVYRALAEDLISRSRAQELLGETLPAQWALEGTQRDVIAASSGY